MTQIINQENHNKVIEYLELSAGMGKTYNTMKWVVENQIPKNIRWVYIAPSKELINETVNLLESFGYEDYLPITDDYYKNGVMNNTLELVCSMEHVGIFLITHANFENIIQKGNEYVFEGFNVVIDELPNVFEMHDISFGQKTDILKDRLSPLDNFDGVYSVNKSQGILKQLQEDGKRNNSIKMNSFGRGLSKSNVVVKEDYSEYSKYQTYNIIDYTKFLECCGRVVLLGAKITSTLVSGLLERQGVVFEPFVDVTLTRTEYLNQERVTIYYLTDEKVKGGCTSSILTSAYNLKTGKKLNYKQYSHLPNGIDDLDDGFVNVYQEYVNRACELLGEDFLYTVNYIPKTKTYRDVQYNGIPYGVCIPYGCHGLNKYSHYTKALSLFCYKPSPVQKKLLDYLKVLFDFPDIEEKYVDLKMREASLQMVTRTAIRDFSNTEQDIVFVVPDISVANYIKEYHTPSCNIDTSLALYIPDARENNGGGNKDTLAEEYNISGNVLKAFNNYKYNYRKSKQCEPSEQECIAKINKLKEKYKDER